MSANPALIDIRDLGVAYRSGGQVNQDRKSVV